MTRQHAPNVFLTWNDSRRSKSLSAAVGLKRVLFVNQRSGCLRHIIGTLQTITFLLRHRPKLIWYQFSLLLGVTLAIYARLLPRTRIRIVADVHTKALRRDASGPLTPIIRALKGWALTTSNCTMVTNLENAAYASRHFGIAPIILTDPLPNACIGSEFSCEELRFDVAFICSFAKDEPLALILEVCKRISDRVAIAITGDVSPLDKRYYAELQKVAKVTGFLSDSHYWKLLQHTRCPVVLSQQPACLQCGAYEAVAVGRRPVLALDDHARAVFGDSAIYVSLNADDLEGVILKVLADAPPFGDRSIQEGYRLSWETQWSRARQVLLGSSCLPVPPGA